MTRLSKSLFLLTVLLTLAAAVFADEAPIGEDLFFEGVELRANVDIDIHVKVFGQVDKNCQLAIHGFIHTAQSWEPYAAAVGGCVLAVDLAGRGGSGLPHGLLYSDLRLDDHVAVILGVLERLAYDFDIEVPTIVTHSQGGLLALMVQERLLAEGTSLEHRFDVREVVVLASASPADVPFFLATSGLGLALFESFQMSDPERGEVIALPAAAFPGLLFTNLAGELVPGAPTQEEIAANGWNAPAEPLQATLQLVGGHGVARPVVRARAFADDTRLRVVAFEEDIVVLAIDNIELYEYLTGDESFDCLATVSGPESVHDMYVSNPEAVAAALAGLENCGYRD